MNNTGTFILGAVAAVVLFMLWRQKGGSLSGTTSNNGGSLSGTTSNNGPSGTGGGGGCEAGGCAGTCGGNCPSPSYAASPALQGAMAATLGAGFITPGTPPLGTVNSGGADTSIYSMAGPTPDATFTFVPPGSPSGNIAGSPSTPAPATPVRANEKVLQYSNIGFVQKQNVVGIPLASNMRRALVN